MSNKFYPIKVKSIEKTTADCSIISLDMPADLNPTFKYKQGQYLTFKKEINGEDIRRSYSLCSGPLDNEWKIGVKKIIDGRFSTYANDVLKVGDTLDVMIPSGNFYIEVDPNQKRNYVVFAAGSGITPILSIIKTHLEAEPKSTFKLFYINQTVASIILKEELEALKNRFMARFEIFYFLTQESRSVPLLNGRLNEEKLEIIFKTICDSTQIDHYFSCGPEPMVNMITKFLTTKGVDKKTIHFELFGTETNKDSERKKELSEKFAGQVCDVTILEGGKSFNFKMEQGTGNILDTALNNSADLPFACKGGVCATCRAKLVEGNVDMLLSYGLEEEEIEQGYILTCQSVPTCDKVVVDFDV